MTPKQIDKIICDWSMKYGIAIPEQALDELVDKLATVSDSPPCENPNRQLPTQETPKEKP